MKKIIEHINVRCIVHATEDRDKVLSALEFITGRRDYMVTNTKGYYGNPIEIIEIHINNSREIEEFWKRMRMLGVVDLIIPLLDELIDENGNLYIRFDKQEAYAGRVAISSSGDTIAVKMKIISYPRRKDKIIKNLKEFLLMISRS